jgi:hypothetical protein
MVWAPPGPILGSIYLAFHVDFLSAIVAIVKAVFGNQYLLPLKPAATTTVASFYLRCVIRV